MLLPTTVVGSFPKPDYLKDARFKFVKKEIDLQELENLTKKASEDAINYQLEAGVDIISDGEMDRGDMATFFAERMDGFKISGLVRSYGNRYYKKPIVVNEVEFIKPMTVDMFKFALERSQNPVKGIFTGPYTMMDWSFDEYYSDRKEMAFAMAKALHKEAVTLEKAGAKYIQIDEPAISTRPEEMDIAIKSLGIVTKGLKAKTITHICYGDFNAIYPKMLKLPIDQIDLEFANRNFELLNTIKQHKFTKEVGLGVIDVHNHRIETVEQVKKGIKLALEVFKPEQIYVDPDCGLKTRMRDEAYQKLKVMVEATREVRKELGHQK
jgi:5-methyltetrahydropteroyltriglutamate--homocysteine methyltransferase